MKKKYLIPGILLLIFLLSLALRFYRIDALSVYADETGHYDLLKLINDTNVNPLVWIFRQLVWRTFTFTWLFGLTPLGVRAASALYGSLMIFVAYYFSLSITKNKNIALLNALLTTIIPWEYMISRIAHTHVVIITALVCVFSYFFLKAKTPKQYLISLIFIILAATYYPSMVIIAPIAVLLTFYYIGRILNKKQRLSLFIFLILLGAVGGVYLLIHYRVFVPGSRGPSLIVWSDVNTTYDTDRYRALSWNSTPSIFSFGLTPEKLANKFFFNRVTANLSIFGRNYLSFFSPDWLFLRGDAILRHSTGLIGSFYPFLLPFMLFGAYRFFRTAGSKQRLFFLVWVLISPLPAAITKDGAGYLLRVVTMLPFLTYFCAVGLYESFGVINSRLKLIYALLIILVGMYSVYYFFYGYFHIYPSLSKHAYEPGFKELAQFQTQHNNDSMLVIWDGYYHYADFNFWQKTPYDQSFEFKKINIGGSSFWQTFPNLYFSAPANATDAGIFIHEFKPRYLVLPDRYFVKYPVELDKMYGDPVKVINYPDNTPALKVFFIK